MPDSTPENTAATIPMDPARKPPGDAAYIDWLKGDRPNVCITITRTELAAEDATARQLDGLDPAGLAQYSIAAVSIRKGRPVTGFTNFIADNTLDFNRMPEYYPDLKDLVESALDGMEQAYNVLLQESER